MSDALQIARRMLLRDMGRAGLAVTVFGTSACADEGGQTTTTTPSGTSTSATNPGTTTTRAPAGTSTTESEPTGVGSEWQRVDLGFVPPISSTEVGKRQSWIPAWRAAKDRSRPLGEIGLGWGDVSTVVVTHLHPDHQGSLSAVISATTDSLPWFAGAADIEGIDAPTAGQPVGDGDTVFHDLEIIETPGHTPGHIAVLPIAGIPVAGDALTGTDGGVAGPNPDFTPDMASAGASVVKMAGFSYEVVLFGHGEPVLSGGSTQVGELAAALG